MANERTFRAGMIEPVADDVAGLAVEFEFHEKVQGPERDTIVFDLRSGATMDEAEALVRDLNALGERVRLS